MDAFDTAGDTSLIQISSGQEPVTSPALVSQVVQDNSLHEVSHLHDSEVDKFASAQDSTLPTVPVESIPRPVPSTASHHRPPHQYRIFLDICCGLQAPLSAAVRQLSGDILQFDILIHSTDDLLDNQCYESLLRVCASGIVAYAGASPSCCEYSRLKLKPGGPPALRTPEFLQGQQPSSAMSWQEPVVQQYLQQEACSCVSIAACGYGRDWSKTWMLASTFSDIEKLAWSCPHPKGTHQQIAGALSPEGHFLSCEVCRSIHFCWLRSLQS